MKYILNINHIDQLDLVCKIQINEVLIQTKRFSRTGFINDNDIENCLLKLKAAGKTLVFEWNMLINDGDIRSLGQELMMFAKDIAYVRFLDPGIGVFLKKEYPNIKLQFSMEFSNFNQKGILKWVDYFSPQLSRIILSNQLPAHEIGKLNSNLEIEVAGCGRLELFHSPRKLVQKHVNASTDVLELDCASEDRPTQISPLIENDHGTLMFYDKDLFLLDALENFEINSSFITRLDLYRLSQYKVLAEFFPDQKWVAKLKTKLSGKTTRGFFRINKSDAPLKRLTNKHIKGASENKLGTILESVKKQHMVVEIQKELQLPAKLQFCSPEGKEIGYIVEKMENLAGNVKFESKVIPGIYKLPWIKHVVASSVLKLF